jgi:hypothetical protein
LRDRADSLLAAKVLEVFATCRTRAQDAALEAGQEWPAAWLADIWASYQVLVEHPAGTPAQVVAGLNWLSTLDARVQQGELLGRALRRWPLEEPLHAWLRTQVLRDAGAEALLSRYDELHAPPEQASTLQWFTGLAALVAAEHQVLSREPGEALRSYRRSCEEFGQAQELNPDYADSSQHYLSLAHAGRARLLADQLEFADAARSCVESLTVRPASATSADGLGNTPVQNAAYVRRVLEDAGRVEEAAVVESAVTRLGLVPAAGRGDGGR